MSAAGETSTFSEMSDRLRRGDFVFEEFLSWPTAMLVAFYLDYPMHQEELRGPIFQPLWQRAREQLRIPSQPDFRFLPWKYLSDIDFVVGYESYLSALQNAEEDDRETYTQHITRGMVYQSFHACQTVLSEMLDNPDIALSDIAKMLSNWVSLAHIHALPGYLLLAHGYIAMAYRQKKDKQNNTEYSDLAYQFLCLAKLSETKSAASINNAWFGQGLSLSNPSRLSNLNEMFVFCESLAKPALTEERKILAETHARSMYSHLRV